MLGDNLHLALDLDTCCCCSPYEQRKTNFKGKIWALSLHTILQGIYFIIFIYSSLQGCDESLETAQGPNSSFLFDFGLGLGTCACQLEIMIPIFFYLNCQAQCHISRPMSNLRVDHEIGSVVGWSITAHQKTLLSHVWPYFSWSFFTKKVGSFGAYKKGNFLIFSKLTLLFSLVDFWCPLCPLNKDHCFYGHPVIKVLWERHCIAIAARFRIWSKGYGWVLGKSDDG